jgi:signal transduction histidine kinase
MLPAWVRWALAIPLTGKLVGANAIIVVVSFVAVSVSAPATAGYGRSTTIVAVALVLALVVNVVLVALALRPHRQMEATVQRVWRGDLEARVPESLLADRDMARVGRTLNLLLEALTSDRDRMRRLARQVISASDAERANVARALHDSAAQAVAALALQASAAAKDGEDSALSDRLQTIKDLAASILDEVRVLGQSIYPRVLDDLGLATALRSLVREAQERAPQMKLDLVIKDGEALGAIPTDVASVLYHVAREGLTNALRHGEARQVHVGVDVEDGVAQLKVVDDGLGFDAAAVERDTSGTGLFGMRGRLALIQGELNIISQVGKGTRLLVSVPLNHREPA